MYTIDINCDMGEGTGDDAAIMPYISSANIACGYHAGSPEIMRETVRLASLHHVAIGAHPGFNDKEGFGRNNIALSPTEVYTLCKEQLVIVASICGENNAVLHHVKPHGALYNMAARDQQWAAALARATVDFDKNLVFYGLSQSCMVTEAERLGLQTVNEVFADRTYLNDGSLTPRSQPNATINRTDQAVKQVLQMIQQQSVQTTNGKTVAVQAGTVCIHGDSPHAVEFAKEIFKQLSQNGIAIQAP